MSDCEIVMLCDGSETYGREEVSLLNSTTGHRLTNLQ
jgi:hypothetical protein